jgi:hypothetical protein
VGVVLAQNGQWLSCGTPRMRWRTWLIKPAKEWHQELEVFWSTCHSYYAIVASFEKEGWTPCFTYGTGTHLYPCPFIKRDHVTMIFRPSQSHLRIDIEHCTNECNKMARNGWTTSHVNTGRKQELYKEQVDSQANEVYSPHELHWLYSCTVIGMNSPVMSCETVILIWTETYFFDDHIQTPW